MRKLATIREIKNITPIKNADMIETLTIDGWQVVSKKGEHKVGDKIVYFEIDSFLPIKEEYEFLRKSSYKKMIDKEGFALRTIKLRGQISQGLVIPVPEELKHLPLGTDVTKELGVIKYEKPLPVDLKTEAKGYMPSQIIKTDEERVQNIDWDTINHLAYHVEEKLEGMSSTFFVLNGEFGVAGRNVEYKRNETNTFWRIAKELNIEDKLRSLGKDIAIQGELIGEGIQSNIYKIKGQTVKFFNAQDIGARKYLSKEEFIDLTDKLQLPRVPVIDPALDLSQFSDVKELLTFADGQSMLYNTRREGIVLVAQNSDKRISFKVISNKYLEKQK